jgi:hypothetical protein
MFSWLDKGNNRIIAAVVICVFIAVLADPAVAVAPMYVYAAISAAAHLAVLVGAYILSQTTSGGKRTDKVISVDLSSGAVGIQPDNGTYDDLDGAQMYGNRKAPQWYQDIAPTMVDADGNIKGEFHSRYFQCWNSSGTGRCNQIGPQAAALEVSKSKIGGRTPTFVTWFQDGYDLYYYYSEATKPQTQGTWVQGASGGGTITPNGGTPVDVYDLPPPPPPDPPPTVIEETDQDGVHRKYTRQDDPYGYPKWEKWEETNPDGSKYIYEKNYETGEKTVTVVPPPGVTSNPDGSYTTQKTNPDGSTTTTTVTPNATASGGGVTSNSTTTYSDGSQKNATTTTTGPKGFNSDFSTTASGSQPFEGTSSSEGDPESTGGILSGLIAAIKDFFGFGDSNIGDSDTMSGKNKEGDAGIDSEFDPIEKDSMTSKVANFFTNNPIVSIISNSRITASGDTCSLSTTVFGREITISFCDMASSLQLIGSIIVLVATIYSFFIAWGRA